MAHRTSERVATSALVVVAIVLAGWALTDAALHAWWGAPSALGALLIMVGTLPLALLRRMPIWSAVLINVATLAFGLGWGTPDTAPPYLAVFVATFGVGAFAPRRSLQRAVLSWVGLGGSALGVQLLDRIEHKSGDVVWMLGTWAVTLVIGVLASQREFHEVRDRASAASTRDEAPAATDRALALERARIARDLLDVVTRSVDTMVADASVGRAESIAGHPTAAAAALDRVEATGQAALAELRRMLDVMRGSMEPPGEPQPGLEALHQLVKDSSAAGWPTRVDVHGRVDRVPTGIGVTAYRIVQEALDDVHRCAAAGTEVRVELTSTAEALVLEVHDNGPAITRGDPTMRERVEMYGGRLEVGPRDPGWQVRAVLPGETG